jgi:hypothetical protein
MFEVDVIANDIENMEHVLEGRDAINLQQLYPMSMSIPSYNYVLRGLLVVIGELPILY